MLRARAAGAHLRHDEAAALAEEAAAIARAAGQVGEQADALLYVGAQHRFAGRVGDAERVLRRAAELFAASGQPDRARRAVVHVGHMFRNAGDLDAAERAFRDAMPAGRAAIGLAAVAADRGDGEGADRWARAALEQLTRHGDREGVAEARLLLGDLARRRGDLEAAERRYRAIVADEADPQIAHLARLDLVLVHYARGDYDAGAADLESLQDRVVGAVTPRLWITVLRTVPRVVGPAEVWEDHLRDLARALRTTGLREPDLADVLSLAARRADAAGLPDRAGALRAWLRT